MKTAPWSGWTAIFIDYVIVFQIVAVAARPHVSGFVVFSKRVVKLIFVRREGPYLFSVKREIGILFFVNRDLNRSRAVKREMRSSFDVKRDLGRNFP